MKFYKYRALDPNDESSRSRLARIVRERTVWCARPDTLNDPQEFAWSCDFTPSWLTLGILAKLLQATKGHSEEEALRRAQSVLQRGALESLAGPIIDEMIAKTRNEIGIACFGSAPDNPVL
jgi:hypothetical protein